MNSTNNSALSSGPILFSLQDDLDRNVFRSVSESSVTVSRTEDSRVHKEKLVSKPNILAKTKSMPDLPKPRTDQFCPTTISVSGYPIHGSVDRRRTLSDINRNGAEVQITRNRNGTEGFNITQRNKTELCNMSESGRDPFDIRGRSSREHHNITQGDRRRLLRNSVSSFGTTDIPEPRGPCSSGSAQRVSSSDSTVPSTDLSSVTVDLYPDNKQRLVSEIVTAPPLPGTSLSLRTDAEEGPEEGSSRRRERTKRKVLRIFRQAFNSFIRFVDIVFPYKRTPSMVEIENIGTGSGIACGFSDGLPCYNCVLKGKDLSLCVHRDTETDVARDPKAMGTSNWTWSLSASPGGVPDENPPPYALHNYFPREYIRPATPLLIAERLRGDLGLDEDSLCGFSRINIIYWIVSILIILLFFIGLILGSLDF